MSWTPPTRSRRSAGRLRQEWLLADRAVAGLDFDQVVDVDGDGFPLRMIYLHVPGEYAGHNGHADLLRESIDGATGR